MKLITVATHSDGYFPFLMESCKRHNASSHLTILGWQQKWLGFNWRNNLVLNFLESIPKPDHEVVCFIDAYDVILLKDFETLEETFKNHPHSKHAIIVSIEQIKSIRAKIGSLYFGKCQGHSINAGCYIGYASNIKGSYLPYGHLHTKIPQQTIKFFWPTIAVLTPQTSI